MTTTYGYSPTRNGVTLRVQATVSGGTVTITPTLSASVPIYDESNSLSWSGAASGSFAGPAIRIGSSSSGKTASNAPLKVNSAGATSFSFNVTRTSSPQNLSLSMSLAGINYAGQTLTATVSFTIPPNPPAAPTGGSASAPYLSGGRWTSDVSWTLPSGATGIRLWRWDTVSDDYTLIANLGAVSSYRDSTLELDNRYWYGVQATNAGGESAFAEWEGPHTPAAAPTSVTASRSGTGIAGTLINQSRLNPSIEIQDSTDGGATWTTVQTIARNGFTRGQQITYALSGIDPSVPHLIRARAVGAWPTPAGTPSAWTVASAPVIIITRPNPPTGLTSGVRPSGGALTLSANPSTTVLPDGSNLSAFEWRHRQQGSSSWTTVTGSSPASLSTSVTGYPSGVTVEHQVRVKGAHADWSDWSAVAAVKLSALPTATITSPVAGSVLAGDTLTITATGHDPDGGTITTARWWLETPAGQTLSPAVETTSQLTSWTYPIKLNDGQQVVAKVAYREPDGLWGEPATLPITVQYVGPAQLAVTTTWDVEHALLLWEWTSQAEPGRPDPIAVDVYLLVDGQRVEMATGLAPDGAWPLRLAPLVDSVYMLAVRSSLPSTTWQTVAVTVDPQLAGAFVVNGGPGYSLTALGEYDVEFVRVGGRDRIVDTGWANSPYARETVRETLTDTREVTLSTFDRINSAEAFAAVQSRPHALWWRDPTGASWPCSMTPPTRSLSRRLNKVVVDFTITRIGGGPSIDEAIERGLVTADTVYADLIPDP